MQLFSADAIVFSKFFDFFYPDNMRKTPSKVALNRHPTFFFIYLPGYPNGPDTEMSYHPKPLIAGLGI